MRKLILSMVTSLDGYIEGPGGEFTPPPWSDEVEREWPEWGMEAGGLFLYGRVNFVFQREFWGAADTDPNSPAAGISYAGTLNRAPKVMVSRTLTGDPGWNGRVLDGDLAEGVRALKAQPGKDIISFGGAGLAHSLIAADLVDEYRLMVTASLFGGGKRLFPDGVRQDLELVEFKRLDVGSLILGYRPRR